MSALLVCSLFGCKGPSRGVPIAPDDQGAPPAASGEGREWLIGYPEGGSVYAVAASLAGIAVLLNASQYRTPNGILKQERSDQPLLVWLDRGGAVTAAQYLPVQVDTHGASMVVGADALHIGASLSFSPRMPVPGRAVPQVEPDKLSMYFSSTASGNVGYRSEVAASVYDLTFGRELVAAVGEENDPAGQGVRVVGVPPRPALSAEALIPSGRHTAVTASSEGDVYVCGESLGLNTVLKTAGGMMTAPGAGYLYAVAPGGKVRWLRSLAEVGDSDCRDIAVAPDGDVVLVGRASTDADFTDGAAERGVTRSGPDPNRIQVYAARFAPDGTRRWLRRIANVYSMSSRRYAIAVAADGMIYVGGDAPELEVRTSPEEIGGNIFVARFFPDGRHDWSIHTEGGAADVAMALDPAGAVILGGEFSDEIQLGSHHVKSTHPEGWGLFVARIVPPPPDPAHAGPRPPPVTSPAPAPDAGVAGRP